ncbi:MAG TPA: class I SAM-dependent methyltransferase [Anaerolineales bacterium]|nr:class I SAM-dependent methyltransferase [Anaerolineales bacterium]
MPYTRACKKPEGQPTRGKTASNRLRRVDNFILLYEPSLLTRTGGLFADALFVDLGYGFDARTTLESAARFRRVNPDLKILGVEIDKERVEAALPFADEKTLFRLGGFNLPLKDGEHVRLIRAFNVLRQYEEKDFAPAYERLAQYVLPGGLMIEGTSTPYGQIWAANLVRKPEHVTLSPSASLRINSAKSLEHAMTETLRSPDGSLRVTQVDWRIEALVFSTNFRLGFDVEEFQTILPKNLIHHVIPGEEIYDFFEAWKASAKETASFQTYGAKQWFIAAAESLAGRGYKINLQKKFLSKGYLVWEK